MMKDDLLTLAALLSAHSALVWCESNLAWSGHRAGMEIAASSLQAALKYQGVEPLPVPRTGAHLETLLSAAIVSLEESCRAWTRGDTDSLTGAARALALISTRGTN